MTGMSNRKPLTAVFCTLLVALGATGSSGASALPAEEETLDGELPTPEKLSALVAADCGTLLRYDLDPLGTAVGLLWRTNYARCALAAVEGNDFLGPLGRACETQAGAEKGNWSERSIGQQVARCSGATLLQQGLGAQYAALVEACALVNHAAPGGCIFDSLLAPLGNVTEPTPAVEEPPCWVLAPQENQSSHDSTAPPSCDPLVIVKNNLCEYYGVCLDKLIEATHENTQFTPVDGDPTKACPGAKVSAKVNSEASGWVFSVGVFTYWSVDAEVSVDLDVSWSLKCDVSALITGKAQGGLFRQLIIEVGDEQDTVCSYDGIIERYCGTGEGEGWTEHVLASGEGQWDHDDAVGKLPPGTMIVSTDPAGQWVNAGDGSLAALKLLDRASELIVGSEIYFVNYADDGGLLSDLGVNDALDIVDNAL